MGPEGTLNRRDFLKLSGLLTTSFLAACSPIGKFAKELSPQHYETLIYINKRYGLAIVNGIPTDIPNFSGDPVSLNTLEQGILIVRNELSKYPPDFFRWNGLSKIILAENIKRADVMANGFTLGSGEIGLRLSTAINNIPDYFIHEEIFHAADYYEGGWDNYDPAWVGLHPPDCTAYGKNSSTMSKSLCPTEFYAKPAGQEDATQDKSNFGEAMMIPVFHKDILKRINSADSSVGGVLQAKYDSVKKNYLDWSRGIMNDGYWVDLMNGFVNENYFN